MAGEDDEVVVQIPAGDDDGVVIEKAKDTSKGEKLESADFNDDPLEDLKGQFATMTQRATAAEQVAQQALQRAQTAEQRAERVETEIVTSQLDTVTSGIAQAEAEAAQAEIALQNAIEAGDAAAMARAQRAIARAESNKVRLEEAKETLEDESKQRTTRQQQTQQRAPQPQQHATQDPVERLASGLTPKSAAWVRAHPEVATDLRKNRLMLAADHMARANGIEVESQEYFDMIEEYVNGKKDAAQPRPKPGDGTRPSSAAASGGDRGGQLRGGAREVKLTRGEAESATDGTLVWNYDDPTGKNRYKKGDPIGLVEMARRKSEGLKRGLYDKNNIEA